MKKYTTPDICILAFTKEEIMFDLIQSSGNVIEGPGDDIYNLLSLG